MSKSLTAFTGFRPLIRGFFFYDLEDSIRQYKYLFPSPHSGILFLLEKGGDER